MKNINYLLLISLLLGSLFTFSGCDDDPDVADISRVTFFPTFAYEGGDLSIVKCGSSYVLPPVTATENGVDLPVTTVTTGLFSGASSFDINVADKYVFTSLATNADGFNGSVVRTVWVVCTGDLVTSLEGLYKSTVVRNGATGPQYTNMEYVLIRKVGPDQYELSDAIGGYYDIGRAYGDAYRAAGMVITANNIPANNFSFSGPIGVGAFGGSLEMTGMTVDPATKTITFTSDWDAGFSFAVTLTQCPI
jgi:hypothetical protein